MKTVLFLASLLCGPGVSLAQTAATPTAYDFLTVLDSESQVKNTAKLVFAPPFQGKSEVQLEALPGTISGKYMSVHQQNLQVVNQQLSELTAAGWELVHVSGDGRETYYLFRKAKR